MKDHTYAVLGVEGDTPDTLRIELWNPWGTGVPCTAMGVLAIKGEAAPGTQGRFWLSFEHFVQAFDVLHWGTPCAALRARVQGCWAQELGTCGGSDQGQAEWSCNPQYELLLGEPSRVHVVLWQAEPRMEGKRNHFQPIGFDIFQPEGVCAMPDQHHVKASVLASARQVALEDALALGAGRYVIVPCMHITETEASFTLDVFVEHRLGSRALEQNGIPNGTVSLTAL